MRLMFDFYQRMEYLDEKSKYGERLRAMVAILKIRREYQKYIDRMCLFVFRKINKLMISIAKNKTKK